MTLEKFLNHFEQAIAVRVVRVVSYSPGARVAVMKEFGLLVEGN